MAGDWIKVELCTPDKPEIGVIADFLKIEPDAAFGKVFRVWAWWDQHSENGNGVRVTTAFIDRIAGTPGVAEAMRFAGWLEERDGGLVLPLYERHNGETGKSRALSAKRQAKFKRNSNASADVEVTESALPREEKRREEVQRTPATAGGESKIPPCPHEDIIELYHEHLPMGRQVKLELWRGQRQARLQSRWREVKSRQHLDWWRRFFVYISESPFLTGKEHQQGREPFLISLDWILKPESMAKIIEGQFNRPKA